MAIALQNPLGGQRGLLTDPNESVTGSYNPYNYRTYGAFGNDKATEIASFEMQQARNYGARENAMTQTAQNEAQLGQTKLSFLQKLLGSLGNGGGGFGSGSFGGGQSNGAGNYQGLMDSLFGQMSGLGNTRRQDINESSANALSAAQGDLTTRGWSNSNLYAGLGLTAEKNKQRAMGQLDEELLGQKLGLQSQIGLAGLQSQDRSALANQQYSQSLISQLLGSV